MPAPTHLALASLLALALGMLTAAPVGAQADLTPEEAARAADGLRATEERSFDLRDVLGRYYPTYAARPLRERTVFNVRGTVDSVLWVGRPVRRTYRALTYADAPAPPSVAEVRGLRGVWRARTDATVLEIALEGGPLPDPDHFAWSYGTRFHAEGPVFGIAPGELLFVSRFDVPARRYRYGRVSDDHVRLTLLPDGAPLDLYREATERDAAE